MSLIGLDPTSGPLPEPEHGTGAAAGVARRRGHRAWCPTASARATRFLQAIYRELAELGGTHERGVRAQAQRVGATRPDGLGEADLAGDGGRRRLRWLRLVQCAQFARLRGARMGRHPERGDRARVDGRQRRAPWPRSAGCPTTSFVHRALPAHPARGVDATTRSRSWHADLAPQLLARLTEG